MVKILIEVEADVNLLNKVYTSVGTKYLSDNEGKVRHNQIVLSHGEISPCDNLIMSSFKLLSLL